MNIQKSENSELLKLEGEFLVKKDVFKELTQPKLFFQDSNHERPFHFNIRQRRSYLKKIYGNTGIEIKKDIMDYFKKHNNNQRRNNLEIEIPLIKEYKNKNENIKSRNRELKENVNKNKNNNLNQISYQTINLENSERNSVKNSLMNYKRNYYNILSYGKKRNLLKTPKIKNNSNYNSSTSRTTLNKDVKIILGRKKTKKFIDFDTINLTNSQRENKNKSSERTTDEKSITVYINSEYDIKDSTSLAKEINTINKSSDKTSKKLVGILKDQHFFPILSNSFKDDIYDIVSKQIFIKRPGRYKFKTLKTNEKKFNQLLNNYWIEKKPDKGVIALNKKHLQIKKEIFYKINNDIQKAEKLNLQLKFGPKDLSIYKKLLQEPRRKKII